MFSLTQLHYLWIIFGMWLVENLAFATSFNLIRYSYYELPVYDRFVLVK